MQRLSSFLGGAWVPGQGSDATLVNPATEAPLAVIATDGYDLPGALAYARATGGPALAALTFAQRATLLGAMAKAIHGAREELIALAVANGGNTRGDAKFDIDGASATLAHYATLGESLGHTRMLADGAPLALGRTARFSGQHAWVSSHGVAVHINAFNFPAWGIAEKAACALLAGMPVLAKPATATALVAHRLMELFAPLLPAGALQLLCGSARTLLDATAPGDVVAFTGSSATAQALRSHPATSRHGLRLNIEADSLNAAVLGPDVELASETGQLFLNDVTRDITQKTGQKCTAIRRIFVPTARYEEVAAVLRERLASIVIGDPSHETVRLGPVATREQHQHVREGIARLAQGTAAVVGDTGDITVAATQGKGFFVAPVVRGHHDATACAVAHEHEVFGPVSTLLGYNGNAASAGELVGRGGGSLVASVYSDERTWLREAVHATACYTGRLYLGSAKMAAQSPGPGTVLPALMHGGPGRAGGGTELGGERGLSLYMQRVALQGDASILKALFETSETPT